MDTIQKFVSSGKVIKKKYKRAMIKKYDKNNDNFITIDEYLDDKISLGPDESKGNINYKYNYINNIYNYFFLIKLKEINKYKVLCIPDFIIQETYEDNSIEKLQNSIYLNLKYNYYIIPDNLKKIINSCNNNKNHRLIYLTCGIKLNTSKHVNMVIIDLKKKTIERYEPYGNLKCNKFLEEEVIINKLFITLLKNTNIDLEYIPPVKLSSNVGIQVLADSYNGMCVTISMLYLQMRLLNIDLKQSKIIDYFLKKDKNTLKRIILRFAKYVQKKLEKYNIEVNELHRNIYYNN